MKYIYITFLLIFCSVFTAKAQQPGESGATFNPDTIFVFKSPRPLLTYEDINAKINDATGLELVLTESGFGFGMFHQRQVSDNFSWSIDFYFSNARNKDEFERYGYNKDGEMDYFVPNKVNRVYKLPIMLGIQYYAFKDLIHKNFRPMITAGFGPTLISENPYDKGWFEAWDNAKYYAKLGGFIGIGANFGSTIGATSSVVVKYYYTPAGNSNIQSLRDVPIENFGGVTISLNVGF